MLYLELLTSYYHLPILMLAIYPRAWLSVLPVRRGIERARLSCLLGCEAVSFEVSSSASIPPFAQLRSACWSRSDASYMKRFGRKDRKGTDVFILVGPNHLFVLLCQSVSPSPPPIDSFTRCSTRPLSGASQLRRRDPLGVLWKSRRTGMTCFSYLLISFVVPSCAKQSHETLHPGVAA